jgi:threonine dehydrogenase-like Zn-dependent dehydrogenase
MLEECPPGSLVVKARFASVCGSDMPYFQASTMKAPSCYWDRDGFCGHEVIGIIVSSKSAQFHPGDPVMALPSSYFKAHAGSKQEWYREDVHGVLLEDFPVRGGFCQIYTSHELYAYKIKECVPRILAAQGLGTVLRMARKLGSVLGKTVVVVGLGQNGLIATRLMSQLCARSVIAVEPLEYRRELALKFGASCASHPDEALDVIQGMTEGRGADVVLEMAGHNQQTINAAFDYVACSGTVAAFGVPDDAVYQTFQYSKFFRKNVNLFASVIPDPGIDFPDAVRLIEEGRFNTEGIFTHTVPLAEVQRGFEVASSYLDGVVKLVIEL